MEIQDYKVGDNVLLYDAQQGKHIHGQIKDIKPDQNSFFYTQYLSREGISQQANIDNCIGDFELVATDENRKESIENIKEKITVYSLIEYIQKGQNQVDSTPIRHYITRVSFDSITQSLQPSLDLEYECLCGKIMNPDHTLIVCEKCQKKCYHYNCLNKGTNCSGCGENLVKENYTTGLQNKRKRGDLEPPSQPSLTHTKSLNTVEDDEDQEELDLKTIETQKKVIKSNKILEMFRNKQKEKEKNQLEKKKPEPGNLQRQNSGKVVNKAQSHGEQQPKKPQQFANITKEQIEELNILVDRYRQSSCISRLQGLSKKRHEVKDRLFKVIVYGMMEIQNKEKIQEKEFNELQKSGQTPDQLDKQRQELNETFTNFKSFDSQKIFDHARNLAIQIELTLFKYKNSQNAYQLTSEYKDRFRSINANMLDDNNYVLRLKVLLKSIKIDQLVSIPETELYNPQKKKEIEKQRLREIQQGKSRHTDFTVIKTKSSDIEILPNFKKREDDDEEKLRKYEEQQEQIRIQNEKRQQLIKIQGKPFQFREFLDVSSNPEKMKQIQKSLNNIDQSQIDYDLVQSILDLTGGNGKERMLQRVQQDLEQPENQKFIDQLELY